MTRLVDVQGQRFGRLQVLGRLPNTRNGNSRWACQCDCGEVTAAKGGALRAGYNLSCGCLNKQKRAERARELAARASRIRWDRDRLSPDERERRKAKQRQAWHQKRRDDPEFRERMRIRSRASHVRRNYGLTVEEYEALLADGCTLCGATSEDARIELDHNHATGMVRAALCGSCNSGLGRFKDKPELLRAAADYIEEMP